MTADFTARSQPAEPDALRVPSLTERITEILTSRPPVAAGGYWHPEVMAALIAQAAEEHYRPRVETVEQLDALPGGSVVAPPNITYATDIGAVAVKWPDHYLAFHHGPWYQTGYERPCPSAEIDLPAVVLWSPGAGE